MLGREGARRWSLIGRGERGGVAGAAIHGVVRSRLTYHGHREGIGSILVRARGAGEVQPRLGFGRPKE